MAENQPGRGRAVLITRPASTADRTAALVSARGFHPIVAPLLRVEPRPVAVPPRIGAVLVTSANALPGLAGRVSAPLLAVGDATAAAARAAGFEAVSAGGNATALLALALKRIAPGTRLLLASGAGQGAALARGLRAAGFPVHRRIAYAIRAAAVLPEGARAALERRDLGAALFLSAETARVFARLVPTPLRAGLAGADALAIAPEVAEALAPCPSAGSVCQ